MADPTARAADGGPDVIARSVFNVQTHCQRKDMQYAIGVRIAADQARDELGMVVRRIP
jgi:hypothetical protein